MKFASLFSYLNNREILSKLRCKPIIAVFFYSISFFNSSIFYNNASDYYNIFDILFDNIKTSPFFFPLVKL